MYGFHFAFFTIISVFKKSKKEKNFKPIHKFLILIPARNEENIITYLIESLKKQNYPNDMYQIYVAPNNCTDKTESVSKKAGAKILKIDIPVQTKGEVLNYAFDKFPLPDFAFAHKNPQNLSLSQRQNLRKSPGTFPAAPYNLPL